MVTMTLMPTYITIDERMRLGYCTPLVEVGPGVWHHLLFGDVVETVYDPRWWILGPGGLRRMPGGGHIGGYFAPGDGPPEMVNCLGDPAIVSGPIYYDYDEPGWWGRLWGRGGRRWRRRRHRRPHLGPPHVGPPTHRGGPPSRRLGPPHLRSPGTPSSSPPSSPPSNNPDAPLTATVMYPSSTPTSPPMTLASHPNAAQTAPMRPQLQYKPSYQTAAPYRAPVQVQFQPSYQTAAPYRAPTKVEYQPSYQTALRQRRDDQIRREVDAWLQPRRAAPMRSSSPMQVYTKPMTAAPYRASTTSVQYKPTYMTPAPMRRSSPMQYAGPRTTMRAMPMRSSGGGFRPAPSTHGMRGLGALLAGLLGR